MIKIITIDNKEKILDVMEFYEYIQNNNIFYYYNMNKIPIYINIKQIKKDNLTIRIFYEIYYSDALDKIYDEYVSQLPSFINSITLNRKNPIYEVDDNIKAKILLLR